MSELTALQFAIRICELAGAHNASEERAPTKAFQTMTKEGMVNVKREAFEAEFAQLAACPLLRVLRVRTAREDEFKSELTAKCMMASPPEHEVMELSSLLTAARNNPNAVGACLMAFEKHIDLGGLRLAYQALWPVSE